MILYIIGTLCELLIVSYIAGWVMYNTGQKRWLLVIIFSAIIFSIVNYNIFMPYFN